MSRKNTLYDRRFRFLSSLLFRINDSLYKYENYNDSEILSNFLYKKDYTSELEIIGKEILLLMEALQDYDTGYEIYMYTEFEKLYFMLESIAARNVNR